MICASGMTRFSSWVSAARAAELKKVALAKVALACVGGNVRDDCDAQACLESSGMPKRVMAWFLNSLAPVAAERPQSIEPLLTEVQRWKSKVTQ